MDRQCVSMPAHRLPGFWAAALCALLSALWFAFWNLQNAAFTDFEAEALPAAKALQSFDLSLFFELAPLYGGSLLIRGPFVALAPVLGDGDDGLFRALAVPGLLATSAFGLCIWTQLMGSHRPRAAWTALAVAVASPLIGSALWYGHPEELLGAVLVVAAGWAAIRGRWAVCSLLLALAVLNKPWALVTVLPVVLLLEHHRLRALATAAAITLVGASPFILAGGNAAKGGEAFARGHGIIFQPWQLGWFLGSHEGTIIGPNGTVLVDYRTAPDWIMLVSHPLTVAVPLLLSLAALWLRHTQRRPVDRQDALSLLVLALLLRTLLDVWNVSYYSVPLVVAVLVWETQTRLRIPVLSMFVAAVSWFTLVGSADIASPDLQAAMHLAWAVPLGVWFTGLLFARSHTERLGACAATHAVQALPTLITCIHEGAPIRADRPDAQAIRAR